MINANEMLKQFEEQDNIISELRKENEELRAMLSEIRNRILEDAIDRWKKGVLTQWEAILALKGDEK
jgi:hypothetical protein